MKWQVTIYSVLAGYVVTGKGRTKLKAMDKALKTARANGIIIGDHDRAKAWAQFYQCVGNISCHGYSAYLVAGTPSVELRKL